MRAGFEKNELLLKMLPKLFFFRILFFLLLGINSGSVLGDCSHENLYRKMKQTNFIYKKKNLGSCKWYASKKAICNCTLILDRFWGTPVMKICTEKWNKLILFTKRKIWGVVNDTLSKKRSAFDFVYENFSSFFKASSISCTHFFFFTIFESFFSKTKNF